MPLYSYVCDSCGARTTKLLPIAQRDEPIHCWGGGPDGIGPGHVGAGPRMRRTFEPPAVQFKGPGVTRGSTGFGKTVSEAKQAPSEHNGESSTP